MGRADAALLEAFHRGIYWDAFADQHEPLAVWTSRLWGADAPYALTIKLAVTGGQILGGIAYERYPASGCGLVTYMVVAPAARGQGLGERLLRDAAAALYAAGAPVVFGEVNDPRRLGEGSHVEPREVARARLARFERWGARVADLRYVQPALGDGLARDRGLALIVLAGATPLPATLAGPVVRAFIAELHAITEGRPPDDELAAVLAAIPETVRLGVVSQPDDDADRDG